MAPNSSDIALYQMNVCSADKNQNIMDTTSQKSQHKYKMYLVKPTIHFII